MSHQPDADQWWPRDRGGRPGWDGDAPSRSVRTPSVAARVAARLVDAAVVAVPLALLLVLADRGLAAAGVEEETRPGILDLEAWFGFDAEAWAGMAVLAGLVFAYVVVAEWGWTATVGKRLFGLRVVGLGGRAPSLAAAARRNLWVLLGMVPAAGGLLVIAVAAWTIQSTSADPHSRGWHDRFAGTTVRR